MGSIAWLRGPNQEMETSNRRPRLPLYSVENSDQVLTDIRPARQDEIPDRPGVRPRRSSHGGPPIPTWPALRQRGSQAKTAVTAVCQTRL